MANFVYVRAAREIMRGDLDLHTGGDDIRVRICMTNTTCDTEEDTAVLADFTTIDVQDGTNYADKALANEIVNEDTTNDRAEFDADVVLWTALGAGARAIAGILVYKFVATDADHVPIAWIDTPSPPNANGGDWSANWNAEGIVQGTTT